jgi:hypothetical protein
MQLRELEAIRHNMLRLKHSHPVEYHLWDAILTVWLMAWVGNLGIIVLELWELATLAVPATLLPSCYLRWRRRAHTKRQLRCDWLPSPQNQQAS